MANHQIDQYIKTVSARLKRLTPAQRAEEIQEIRQHLEALIAGYVAQGRSEDEATGAAIRQFGRAEQIGRELGGAWALRQVRRLWPYAVAYVSLVLLIFGFFALANDQPSDFPYGWANQLIMALVLPAGMFSMGLIKYLRHRRALRRG
ncbi:MAG: hypothetical protein H0T53_02560 [Herpetosiphonaceae bacterium]|nr:hypothetical protein [Herpetosiphonaceae bacterium]